MPAQMDQSEKSSLLLLGMHLPLAPCGSSLPILEGEALLQSSEFGGELVSETPANFWWFPFTGDINPNISELRCVKELIHTSPK